MSAPSIESSSFASAANLSTVSGEDTIPLYILYVLEISAPSTFPSLFGSANTAIG